MGRSTGNFYKKFHYLFMYRLFNFQQFGYQQFGFQQFWCRWATFDARRAKSMPSIESRRFAVSKGKNPPVESKSFV